ncbi:MAG: hypothetical protein D6739_07290 [Nitrospirae bacterium]|nr:MAG: hypothetical protein D6739_07290 [Nitrospirota bacterium]
MRGDTTRRIAAPLALAVLLALGREAAATTYSWSCNDGSWEQAECWTPAGVPTSADTASLSTVGGSVTVLRITDATGEAQASEVHVTQWPRSPDAAPRLEISGGRLTASKEFVGSVVGSDFKGRTGQIRQTGGVNWTDYLYLSGVAGVGEEPPLAYSLSGSGYLHASGISVGGSSYYNRAAFLQEGGVVDAGGVGLHNGSTYTLTGGTLRSSRWETINEGLFLQAGGEHQIAERLDLSFSSGEYRLEGGSLEVPFIDVGTRYSKFTFAGGRLSANVVRTPASWLPLVNQGGTLAPGGAPGATGRTTIVHGYTVDDPRATLEIDIAGPAAESGYDQVDVWWGDATLGGILEVALADYVPEVGDSFDILKVTNGRLNGTFDETHFPVVQGISFAIDYLGDRVRLTAVAVPEPTALLLTATPLFGLAAWRHRRHG